MLMSGQGVEQSDQESLVWLRKAAENGVAKAQFNLATMLDSGRGGKVDQEQAVVWFQKSAEQGIPEAQVTIGERSFFGEKGCQQDYATAYKWLEPLARQGRPDAQNLVGFMLENGFGVAANPSAAVAMYRKAAERGFAKAQTNLGLAFASGTGVQRDVVQALVWLQLASDQGEVGGKKAMENLMAALSPESIEAAQKALAQQRKIITPH
jgi:TPR repeat protein